MPSSQFNSMCTPDEKASKKEVEMEFGGGVEGVVAFDSLPDVSYRYCVTTTDDALRIWLEHRKTKQQWQTAALRLKDFVTDKTTIPGSTFDDYVKCFLSCLESTSDSDEFTRALSRSSMAADALVLQLTLKIRVFSTVWTPTYSFLLEPVALEQVDIVQAQVRDQAEQIEELQRVVGGCQTNREAVFFHAVFAGRHSAGQTLEWEAKPTMERVAMVETKNRSSVRLNAAGTFVVHVKLEFRNTANYNGKHMQGAQVVLMLCVNDTLVDTTKDFVLSSMTATVSLYHVFSAKPGDKISVEETAGAVPTVSGTLFIHELP